MYMKFPDGSIVSKSISMGQLSTNFRADACAVLLAVQILNARENPLTYTVITADCRSLLQSLQTCKREQLLSKIREELGTQSLRMELTLQWILYTLDPTGDCRK